jgi:uncharacterized membrane protein YeaQ/YmgE (transglycosylase-associated protein family)
MVHVPALIMVFLLLAERGRTRGLLSCMGEVYRESLTDVKSLTYRYLYPPREWPVRLEGPLNQRPQLGYTPARRAAAPDQGELIMEVMTNFGGLISWVVFGALAGWVAGTLAGTKDQAGCLTNIVVGIIGAFIGGFLWSFLTKSPAVIGWSFGGFVLSVIGALVLLGVMKALRK